MFLLVTILFAAVHFAAFFQPDVRPGYGVTDIGWLSDYFPPLKGTNLDTPVFYMDSGVEGPTFLLMGGTHAREIAGIVAATIFVENAVVKKGRVIVIPYANKSAASIPDGSGKVPHFLPINSRSGPRYLVYGDRRTDPADQGIPDPEKFVHPSGFELEDGSEARNLNRQYPGLPGGNPTQQLAYAIIQLIKAEDVDFNLDMHESGTPEEYTDESGQVKKGSRLAYTLVCNPAALEIGAMALLMLEEQDISFNLEESNPEFRGLSHLEIYNATGSLSFLSETPNPGQDRWREKPDVINDPKYPLKLRVGMQLELIRCLIEAYNMYTGEELLVECLPSFQEIMEKDVINFMN